MLMGNTFDDFGLHFSSKPKEKNFHEMMLVPLFNIPA